MKPVYYSEYLSLPKLLDAQTPLSRESGSECHDEMLFILVHQVYELWFKQILHDLRSIVTEFKKDSLSESTLPLLVQRLQRVIKIQNVMIQQFDILETMTPMDFLEFRELLMPASGFQSLQFREIEIRLGLSTDDRVEVDRKFFTGRLNDSDRKALESVEKDPSLLRLVERWLERTPFTADRSFNFWDEYQKAVSQMLTEDEATIRANVAALSSDEIKAQLENLQQTRVNFDSLFDAKAHATLVGEGKRKLSQKAILNSLFILLYRDEPMLSYPFELITALMDIDENFTAWRHRHALLAHRMLGTKIGTGGSSGHVYLKRAAENNRVFTDFFNLSSFMIPRSKLPVLPAELRKRLGFPAS